MPPNAEGGVDGKQGRADTSEKRVRCRQRRCSEKKSVREKKPREEEKGGRERWKRAHVDI